MSFARTAAVAATSVLALAACRQGNPPPEPSPPAAGAGSTHFAAVSAQLDTGGEVFAYAETEGDAARLATAVDGTVAFLEKHLPDRDPGFPGPTDTATLASALGLGSVAAVGISSVAEPDRGTFLNRTFVYTPGGREGLLRATGGEARPLRSLDFAPAGSDFVYEADLDIGALHDAFRRLFPDGEARPTALGGFATRIGRGLAQLAGKTRGHLQLVVQTVPGEPFPVPAKSLVDQPAIDLVLVLSNMPWLFGEIETLVQDGSGSMFLKEDTPEATTYRIPEEQAGTSIYAPFLTLEKGSGDIVLASRPAFLDVCRSTSPKLGTDPDYRALAAGLPLEGNAFVYRSPEFASLGRSLVAAALELASGVEVPQDELDPVLEFWMPHLGQPGVSLTANLADGVLVTSRGGASHKGTLLALAAPFRGIAPGFASLFPGVGTLVPAAPEAASRTLPDPYTGAARRAAPAPNQPPPPAAASNEILTGIYRGLRKYARENGGFYPPNLRALSPSEHLSQDVAVYIVAHRDKIYYRGGLTQASGADEILVGTASADTDGMRTAVLNNGVVQKIAEADFVRRTDFSAPVSKPPGEDGDRPSAGNGL